MTLQRRLFSLGARAAVAAMAGVGLATPAFAQTGADTQPYRVPVMIWTVVVVCLAMLILSLGYLYRRTRGAQDEVIPKNVDPYYTAVGHNEEHSTGELHPELEGPPHTEHEGAGHAA
jgi:hypothetical protein